MLGTVLAPTLHGKIQRYIKELAQGEAEAQNKGCLALTSVSLSIILDCVTVYRFQNNSNFRYVLFL